MTAACRRRKVLSCSLTQAMAGCARPVRQRCPRVGRTRRPARCGRRGSAGGLDTTEVREWARAQGIEVKDLCRVPADLVAKFKAATGQRG